MVSEHSYLLLLLASGYWGDNLQEELVLAQIIIIANQIVT